jgi:hypothetical protein
MKPLAGLLLTLSLWAQQPPTRLADGQVAAPVVLDPRVSIVLPNGVRAYARLDSASLALVPGTTANDPPTLKAVGGASQAGKISVVSAIYDTTLNDGTFSWSGNGIAVLVFRNGGLLFQGVDYAAEPGKIKITPAQGYAAADRVLVVAQ